MSSTIPITEFAPAERVPIEVVRRQAAAITETPLTAELLNAVLNYVFILNPQRQIVFATRNWQDLLPERKPEDLLGLRPGEALGCLHATERESGCGTTVFCQECGAVKAVLCSLAGRNDLQECRLTRRVNGREEALDLLVSGHPLRVQAETYSLFAVMDISHEKRRRVLERIFFHDVLNTATGLEGLAGLLEESLAAEYRDDLQVLHDGLADLREQVQTQKDLVAAETYELPVRPAPLNPGALFQEVARLYERHLLARDRRVSLAPASATTEIVSDPTLLKRVLGNLLKNALEAAAPGQTVRAGCEDAEGGVRFFVNNPGHMLKEVQLQVFSRSFSTKGLGRGLGTYCVRLLSEHYLKGRVGFTSEPGEGTTFFLWLPRRL